MGLLASLLTPRAQADQALNPPPPDNDYWYEPFGTAAVGVPLSAQRAMQCAAVYACWRVLSEAVAMLPLILYARRPDNGKQRLSGDPLYRLLHDRPNRLQTAFQYWETVVLHLVSRGHHTALKMPGPNGVPSELVPLHPDKVDREKLSTGRLRFTYRPEQGGALHFTQDEVFHVEFATIDGVQPINPIQAMARSVRLALFAEEHGERFFKNDARSAIAITGAGPFRTRDDRQEWRRDFQEQQTGTNRYKVIVLEGGMDVKQLTIDPKDAQFLETRTFQLQDIARCFRVAPHLIGELTRSTNNNIEQQGQEFLTLTLMPWLRRIEQAVQRDLILEPGQFAEFLVDGLLRADLKSRYDAYASAINAGWMSRNEARVKENMDPRPEADALLEPLNMNRAGQTAPGQSSGSAPSQTRAQAIALGQVQRLVDREMDGLCRLAEKHANDFEAWTQAVPAFYAAHGRLIGQVLCLPAADVEAYMAAQAAAVRTNGLDHLPALAQGGTRALLQLLSENGYEDAIA